MESKEPDPALMGLPDPKPKKKYTDFILAGVLGASIAAFGMAIYLIYLPVGCF